jgi:mannosyltransferase
MLKTAETIEGHRPALTAIGVIVVIGALLRLHNLGSESLWFDEAASWMQAKDSLAALIQRTAADNYPPLHNLALFVAIKLFGDSEWSLRLPSVIFGVANIGALYWLGTMTVGRTAGLIGAIMLALSPFHFVYSQEARMYSLIALAATLYAATCFHYLRAPSLLRGAWVSLSGLALVYSHPYGTLYWITIAVAFAGLFLPAAMLSSRGVALVWAGSNIIVAAGFAPWAFILADRAHAIGGGFWITLTPLFLGQELGAITGGRLFFGGILIGAVLGVIGQRRKDVALLCAWIGFPVAIGIVVSILWTSIFLSRYVIGSHPPLLLLAAFGWTKYAKDWRGAILCIGFVAVITMASLPFLRHPPYATPRDDWRGVASFLDKQERPGDCILFVPAYEHAALYYYRRNSFCHWGAMKVADLPTQMPASVLFGLFDLHNDKPTELSRVEAFTDELRRQGWYELDRTNFRGIRVVTFGR